MILLLVGLDILFFSETWWECHHSGPNLESIPGVCVNEMGANKMTQGLMGGKEEVARALIASNSYRKNIRHKNKY